LLAFDIIFSSSTFTRACLPFQLDRERFVSVCVCVCLTRIILSLCTAANHQQNASNPQERERERPREEPQFRSTSSSPRLLRMQEWRKQSSENIQQDSRKFHRNSMNLKLHVPIYIILMCATVAAEREREAERSETRFFPSLLQRFRLSIDAM
jgi:hypothetical protein